MSQAPSHSFDDGAASFVATARTSSGSPVDFRRAVALMNPDLLKQAFERFGRPAAWPADPCVPSDYLARVWGYYCHLHVRHFDRFFEPDSNPHWGKPTILLGLIADDAVIMVGQIACSGECLFAHRYMPLRRAANDR